VSHLLGCGAVPFLKPCETGVRLYIRVQPGAKKPGIVGLHAVGARTVELKVRIASPPVEGAANEALIDFLADLLDVKKSQVELVSGHTSRSKQVVLHRMAIDAVRGVLTRGLESE